MGRKLGSGGYGDIHLGECDIFEFLFALNWNHFCRNWRSNGQRSSFEIGTTSLVYILRFNLIKLLQGTANGRAMLSREAAVYEAFGDYGAYNLLKKPGFCPVITGKWHGCARLAQPSLPLGFFTIHFTDNLCVCRGTTTPVGTRWGGELLRDGHAGAWAEFAGTK